jgi:hypothetical protein
MAKKKVQTAIYKTLHRNLKIEQHDPRGVVPALHVVPVLILLLQTR